MEKERGEHMAKVIMVQGTMSNVGKSVITAGLCRIFKQDGYKVAPFKSQNMALNSYITKDGLEIGRAQAMQAEAAGIKPTVAMNPILIKPTSDVGSQVIVNGVARGNMKAKDYFAKKTELIPEIKKAFHTLEQEYDIIVIEGAGSPAEINLKQNDIVNMGMAKLVDAPVLLVGDIDRGGVFAQLVGTLTLLEEEERQRIKGLIINKFRGDLSLLTPGIEMLKEYTDIPVVGVAPYVNVTLEDEDSLSDRFDGGVQVKAIDIAVIRYPRISNFTDMNPLEGLEEVSLRYVHSVRELGNPDLIILPGSKNTMEDLSWLRQTGLESMILKHVNQGMLLFGICGGFQMLGETIVDTSGVESGGTIKGMGLLAMETEFEEEKVTTQVTGQIHQIHGVLEDISGCRMEGYEIHMGRSRATGPIDVFCSKDQENQEFLLGAYAGHVYGTYVHGIFDKKEIANGVIGSLAKKKGIDLSEIKELDYEAFKETQYELLAEKLREYLNMDRIYQILDGE